MKIKVKKWVEVEEIVKVKKEVEEEVEATFIFKQALDRCDGGAFRDSKGRPLGGAVRIITAKNPGSWTLNEGVYLQIKDMCDWAYLIDNAINPSKEYCVPFSVIKEIYDKGPIADGDDGSRYFYIKMYHFLPIDKSAFELNGE